MTTDHYSGQRLTTHHTMNTHAILQSAAEFNSRHDYDLDAVLHFATVAAKHAHTVQLARKEQSDPQLVLPLDSES